MANSYWYQRGFNDGKACKGPLFRNTANRGTFAVGEVPQDWTAEEERAKGNEYLNGYDRGLEDNA